MRACEFGTQPLAGEKLHRLNQRAAVASLSPCQPSQRAFGFIDSDIAKAGLVADLAAAKLQMLCPQWIDAGVIRNALRLRFLLAHRRAHNGTDALSLRRSVPQACSRDLRTASNAGSSRWSSINWQACAAVV